MLILQNISYSHPNGETLFYNLQLSVHQHHKIALIGNNGTGKSTLLKIIAGILPPNGGVVKTDDKSYYVPQHFGQYNDAMVAEALHISDKLTALHQILNGDVTDSNMALLDDDWTIEERCNEALTYWKLEDISLQQKMATLSGGQKTKVFLAGILIHQPKLVLLDEPSNHLDTDSREILYRYIQAANQTMMVVSHDRTLLNLLPIVYELSKKGITVYGGNYQFYTEQKQVEEAAFQQDLKSKEKALRKAKEMERESAERQQKLDARAEKNSGKAGIPTIVKNLLRNSAEKSTARSKEVHADKVESIAEEVTQLRKAIPDLDKMKFGFSDSALHKGKILITAKDVNFSYEKHLLWKENLHFIIHSGDRIAIKGGNGSGKTTLIKLLLNELQPSTSTINRADMKAVYIDQDYSLIQNNLSVYEQAQQFNTSRLQEHEVKVRLARFLYTKSDWDKQCSVLSGGEKMRLLLCCLTISNQAPDMIVLDEPTNNLDIQNIEILTAAINDYKGTLIVVSHDAYFLEQVGVETEIRLNS